MGTKLGDILFCAVNIPSGISFLLLGDILFLSPYNTCSMGSVLIKMLPIRNHNICFCGKYMKNSNLLPLGKKKIEWKNVYFVLSISVNKCFGCSKGLSH